MIMHAFKDNDHLLELQDDNGDIVGYTAIELFDHLTDMNSTNSKNILYWFKTRCKSMETTQSAVQDMEEIQNPFH